jgi:phosphate acyltransferase
MHHPERPLVAVDAMGGDFGPDVVVPGVLTALREDGACTVALYGDQTAIAAALTREGGADDLPVSIVDCRQDIAMGESPAAAVRNRPDSPIVRAMRDQREGRVDAVVSAGSTGAMVAASLLILGRATGCERPAIATPVPTLAGEILMLDGGANVACTPELLVSFARMGDVYCRVMRQVAEPRIGLLNIGSEPGKGSELTITAHELLAASGLHFTGNVEGNDVLGGVCDVLITDGFTGNVALKLIEGFSQFLGGLARSTDLATTEREALTVLGRLLHRRFNYEIYGGAPLLGVAGVSIICHGRSSSRAFRHAVRVAQQQARAGLPDQVSRALTDASRGEEDAQ